MRIALLVVALALPAAAARRSIRVPLAAPPQPHVTCPQQAPRPAGICSPYDRDYCRFADGTLFRDDPRDERAPYLLKQVAPAVYCRYDAEQHLAGVVTVQSPEEQKRRWDATKARRHH